MLTMHKKLTSSLSSFFQKLQRYYKLAILGTLGIPDHNQHKQHYPSVETFDVCFHVKNPIYPPPPPLFFELCITNLLSLLLWICQPHPSKSIAPTCKKI